MNSRFACVAAFVIVCGIGESISLAQGTTSSGERQLNFASAPTDNPLKGFFPFRGDHGDTFPHSMEWAHFPLNRLMDGPKSFTFDAGLEPALRDIAARGHQLVMRVFLDYPREPTGVPKFLIDQGLKMRPYRDHGGGKSPDYADERLVTTLETFIAAFGKQYDGDARIGFITVGLLGFWGEWHTYPHEDWFASVEVQNRILRAYSNAFKKTRLLVRYPAADSPKLPFGFHDDSFAHSTLPTIDWHFLAQMKRASAIDRWKTQPIGGELRPEVQSFIWKRPLPSDQKFEDFRECVRRTHCSWLLNQHAFNRRLPDKEFQRATAAAKSLGYELFVSSAHLSLDRKSKSFRVSVTAENRGVAPFYYDWPVQLRVENRAGETSNSATSWKLTSVLPGRTTRWQHAIRMGELSKGNYRISMRVANPLKNGKPFHFANRERKNDGWLPLGSLRIK